MILTLDRIWWPGLRRRHLVQVQAVPRYEEPTTLHVRGPGASQSFGDKSINILFESKQEMLYLTIFKGYLLNQ